MLIDLLTKWLVFEKFEEAGRVIIIPKVLGIICSENEGIVFGLAQGYNGVFIVLSFIAIASISLLHRSFNKSGYSASIAFGMILSGAIGNLWDRIFYHHVRDFIDVHVGRLYHWPTFNVADAFICIGVGLLLCGTLLRKDHGNSLNC